MNALALAGRIIARRSRQLEELVQMLEKEGAMPLRCPLLAIPDAPDEAPFLAWLDRLESGAFDWLILLTGEGLRRLLNCAERHGRKEKVIAALTKTRTITRGPKPAKALKEIGLTPTLTAQAPTTDGVIASLRSMELRGLTVGVQLYNESNPPLEQLLHEAGATPIMVQPYIYAPAADTERVGQLLDAMAAGKVDAIVFTSSPQIDRLFEVAEERQALDLLKQGFAKTRVACVGPIVKRTCKNAALRYRCVPIRGSS